MVFLKDFFRLRHHYMVDNDVLDSLFLMERRTLVTLLLLETILLYILTPKLGNMILVWYGLTATLTLWRLYVAYDYRAHPERNTPLVWHKKLVVQTWVTGLLFSLLALFGMPQLNNYYQLFTVMVLGGMSIGVVRTLPGDYRTAVGYLLILLFPLSVEMVLLMRLDTLILAFLIVLYFFAEVSILLQGYRQSIQLQEHETAVKHSRELLRQTCRRTYRFFEQSSDGILSYDAHHKILDCNQTFLKMFSLERDHVIGKCIDDLPDDRLAAITKKALKNTEAPYVGSYRSQPDEHPFWLDIKCSPLKDDAGHSIGGVMFVQDRTREQMAILELEHLASHDPLTHVFNRRGFMEYLKTLISKPRHKTHYSLLFYFDMDKFKYINDRFGHEVGDKVLSETARRIRSLARKKSSGIARLGGDEFCLVVPFVSREKSTISSIVETWLETIQKSLAAPFFIEGRKLDVGCSVGAVVIDTDEHNMEKVIAHADIAMFQAKRSGQKGMVVYDAELGERHRKAYAVQHSLEHAIKWNQLEMHYQPIVRSDTGEMVSVEALVRWRHPKKGLLSPEEFLPVAIETGQIAKVDLHTIDEVLQQISEWKNRNIFSIEYVAINVDMRSLLETNIIGQLLEMMERYHIRNEEIRLEITESSLADNFDAAQQIIQALHYHGIGCAIDDFGTGYSSLSYLKRFEFEILKMDREFVQDMLERLENIAMVRTIIDIGQQFNCTVIAEGVETAEQQTIIRSIDPDVLIQGYLTGHPAPPSIVEASFPALKAQTV